MGNASVNGIMRTCWCLLTIFVGLGAVCAGENLIEDPSFETSGRVAEMRGFRAGFAGAV